MPTKIQKWGNSLAVRLPKKLAVHLNLHEGSEVMLDEHERQALITPIALQKKTGKRAWKKFVMPTTKKKENVGRQIDEILYGKSY